VGTGANSKKHVFPFAGQAPHGCITVNLFVSRPLQKYLPSRVGKNSGERSLNLRLKRMKHNTLQKFLSLREAFLSQCFKILYNKF
jgi:hypothetical protein